MPQMRRLLVPALSCIATMLAALWLLGVVLSPRYGWANGIVRASGNINLWACSGPATPGVSLVFPVGPGWTPIWNRRAGDILTRAFELDSPFYAVKHEQHTGRPVTLCMIPVFPLFVIATMAWLLARRGFATKPDDPTCENCGFCLIGNVSGVCPECGTAMTSKHSEGNRPIVDNDHLKKEPAI